MRALPLAALLLLLLPAIPAVPAAVPTCGDAYALAGAAACDGYLRVAGYADTCVLDEFGAHVWTRFTGHVEVDGAAFDVANADVVFDVPRPDQDFLVIGGDAPKNYCRTWGQGALTILAHPGAADAAVGAACSASADAGVAPACAGVVVLRGMGTCPAGFSTTWRWTDFSGSIVVDGAVWRQVSHATVVIEGILDASFCQAPGPGTVGARFTGVVAVPPATP